MLPPVQQNNSIQQFLYLLIYVCVCVFLHAPGIFEFLMQEHGAPEVHDFVDVQPDDISDEVKNLTVNEWADLIAAGEVVRDDNNAMVCPFTNLELQHFCHRLDAEVQKVGQGAFFSCCRKRTQCIIFVYKFLKHVLNKIYINI